MAQLRNIYFDERNLFLSKGINDDRDEIVTNRRFAGKKVSSLPVRHDFVTIMMETTTHVRICELETWTHGTALVSRVAE